MKILGQGSFGTVRLAEIKNNSFIQYAIKSIKKEKIIKVK